MPCLGHEGWPHTWMKWILPVGQDMRWAFLFILDAAQISPLGPSHSLPHQLGTLEAHILLLELPLVKGQPLWYSCLMWEFKSQAPVSMRNTFEELSQFQCSHSISWGPCHNSLYPVSSSTQSSFAYSPEKFSRTFFHKTLSSKSLSQSLFPRETDLRFFSREEKEGVLNLIFRDVCKQRLGEVPWPRSYSC